MKSKIVLITFISFCIISCQEMLFNEDESTRELLFESFNSIKVSGIYNIVLIQDSTNRLVISGRNDIKSIDVVIDNDTLVIDDHKKMPFNPNRNTLAIHFTDLSYMVTYDPVNVSNEDTLKADQFIYYGIGEITEAKLVVDCNNLVVFNSANTLGIFQLSGKSSSCSFYNRYGCRIIAGYLFTRRAEVINESIGEVHVNASDHIKAYILGRGNIYYRGSPVIEIAEKRGEGNIICLDQK